MYGNNIKEEYLKQKKNIDDFSPITEINTLVRNILSGSIRLDSITAYQEKLLFGKNGIFWTTEYSNGNIENDSCNKASNTLTLLGVKNSKGGMVIGHTPQKTINEVCSKKIWRIDTGMSKAFGKKRKESDRIEILEILYNGTEFNILK